MSGRLRYGLKMWSRNVDVLPEATELVRSDVFQYIEVTIVPGSDVYPFAQAGVPFAVHAPSDSIGHNIADASERARNTTQLRECLAWADELGATQVVVHPGFGRMEDALALLDDFTDGRILIENLPKAALWGGDMLGYDPPQVRRLMGRRFGLCLDINHAIKAAAALGVPYREFLPMFRDLRPRMLHISDGSLSVHEDEHRGIGTGEYDFEYLAAFVHEMNVTDITLETIRTDLGSFEEALVDLERLRTFMG